MDKLLRVTLRKPEQPADWSQDWPSAIHWLKDNADRNTPEYVIERCTLSDNWPFVKTVAYSELNKEAKHGHNH